MKTIITKNERLQLIGLLTLAKQHHLKEEEAREAAKEIMISDDSDAFDDWFSEGIWNDYTIDKILKDTGVAVIKAKK